MNYEKLELLTSKFLKKYPLGFDDENFIKEEKYKLKFNEGLDGGLKGLLKKLKNDDSLSPDEFYKKLKEILNRTKMDGRKQPVIMQLFANRFEVPKIRKFFDFLSVAEVDKSSPDLTLYNSLKRLLNGIENEENFEELITEFNKNLKEKLDLSIQFISILLCMYNPQKFTYYRYNEFKKIHDFLGIEGKLQKGIKGLNNINLFAKDLFVELRKMNPKDLVDIQGFVHQVNEIIDEENEMKKSKKGYNMDVNITLSEMAKRRKQIILEGPPGTGKTYNALKYVAEQILDEKYSKHDFIKFRTKKLSEELNNRWEIVQFHPGYSYEDFVQGIVTETNTNGDLIFSVRDKIFLNLVN